MNIIKQIKIFGERNSGTNFIRLLLEKNIKGIDICSHYYKGGTGWKHGIPNLELFKDRLNDTLFVFVIRDLKPWLKSMYNNPYHIKKTKDINTFLTKPIVANDPRIDHDVHVNKEETGKDIFELRYYKIDSYIQTFEQVSNALFVNLEDLQQDKGLQFINIIRDKFNVTTNSPFSPIEKHTKIKTNTQNQNLNIILDDNIIQKRSNIELETFVENLKKSYHMKIGGS